jgi:hypothetical protein
MYHAGVINQNSWVRYMILRHSPVSRVVMHLTCNEGIGGSNPSQGTKFLAFRVIGNPTFIT